MIELNNDNDLEKISLFVDRTSLSRTLNVSTRTIENWEKEGLPHYQITSHTTRYNMKEVDAWIKSKRVVSDANSKVPRQSIGNIPEIAVKRMDAKTIAIAVNGVHFEFKEGDK